MQKYRQKQTCREQSLKVKIIESRRIEKELMRVKFKNENDEK